MGFFDKLLGKLENARGQDAKKNADSTQKPVSTQMQSEVAVAVDTSTPVFAKTYDTGDSYFASIITEANFPGYTISTNVHASTFDSSAHPSCYPISYLFSNNSEAVLAVLVMNTNQYRSMIARGTYKVLEENGIRYIRFFKGRENEKGYVLNRIRENLK